MYENKLSFIIGYIRAAATLRFVFLSYFHFKKLEI